VRALGIDQGGVPWVLIDGRAHFFDGEHMRPAPGDGVAAAPLSGFLLGGGARGLFAASHSGNAGKLHRLAHCRVTFECDYYHDLPDVAGVPPAVYTDAAAGCFISEPAAMVLVDRRF
jgi:hypothetical protein